MKMNLLPYPGEFFTVFRVGFGFDQQQRFNANGFISQTFIQIAQPLVSNRADVVIGMDKNAPAAHSTRIRPIHGGFS